MEVAISAVLKPSRFADAEDYLAWEAQQPQRHEYVDGEVYATVRARLTHNTIALNVCGWLRQALRGGPCRVYGPDAKLQVAPTGDHLYPDAMVTCDPADLSGGEDRFVRHPWLVVEVLSDSAVAFDRGRKFELYRHLPSLMHYLLVEQDRPHADLFFRNPQGQWVLQPAGPADSLQVDRLPAPWPVASLYEDVDFSRPLPEAAAAAAEATPATPPATPPASARTGG